MASGTCPAAEATSVPLEPGDAPCVRDLLLEHFRGTDVEVEGKLGRWSKDRFTAGVSAQQFALLEARLQDMAADSITEAPPSTTSGTEVAGDTDAGALLGLIAMPRGGGPEVEVTLDRFHILEFEVGGRGAAGSPAVGAAMRIGELRGGRRKSRAPPTVRASFACDAASPSTAPRPASEPYEVLRKSRLSDCYVACAPGDRASGSQPQAPSGVGVATCPVSLRVSFSRETELPRLAVPSAVIYERLKRRRIWEAQLWQIALTHVTDDDGREAFEVEVELHMKAVLARLDAESPGRSIADEALLVTRELVAVLRRLAAWASEVPCAAVTRKRRRLEEAQAADPYLREAMQAPGVVSDLQRRVSEGKEALHEAKEALCKALREHCPAGAVEEVALQRFAGQQVARAQRHAAHGKSAEALPVGSQPCEASQRQGPDPEGPPP